MWGGSGVGLVGTEVVPFCGGTGMRARDVRALGGVAAVAVLLVVASGCGGSGGGGGAKGGGRASGSATSPGATATASAAARPAALPVPTFTAPAVITEQQLKSLTFKEGATPGTYGMPVTGLKEDEAKVSPSSVTPAACQDVRDIVYGRAAPTGVDQLINWKSDIYPGDTTLAAYPRKGAQELFRILNADLPLCHALSGVDFGGNAFTNRIVALPAPHVGDEAVRFQEVAKLSGKDVRYTDTVVVRVGDVIAEFDMVDTGRQTPFPPGLIAEQVRRLASAQR